MKKKMKMKSYFEHIKNLKITIIRAFLGLFLIVFFSNVSIVYASDGIHPLDNIVWSKNNEIASDIFNGITFHDNTYVTVGNFGVIKTSTDGENWTHRESGTSQNLNSIIWDNTKFWNVNTLLDNFLKV